MTEIQNSKHTQDTENEPITVLVIEYCNLSFICYLVLGI